VASFDLSSLQWVAMAWLPHLLSGDACRLMVLLPPLLPVVAMWRLDDLPSCAQRRIRLAQAVVMKGRLL
jgi:hypothetical protein